ncbi:diguanylate cyclase (GGDEF)-like protein [Motilibacter rhizosphaerae]|uniref:Diguanylate cyclase (GGDEF)-like protein n=1 Tax=Motilibacter rhizosphaerae TaxID=598652 RepID=A0A4V2F4G6_9ACTN|nr:EAL domain-containing protein [Motilibacter rhizosphaerae]RZS87537.1 diguanylate cyclase (GGDEF)-like protein [Motilibacter rhizosphaerae]
MQQLAEDARLAVLDSYAVLDTPPEAAYDQVTRALAERFGTKTALVTLVDRERQWFKSRWGFEERETPREVSFCARTMHEPDLLVVPDATADPRFRDNPYVTGPDHVRFYAGAPLVDASGAALGAVCVVHDEPRELLPEEAEALRAAAEEVRTQLQLRRSLRELTERVTGRADVPAPDLLLELLDRSPSGLAVLSPELKVLWCNEPLGRLVGSRGAAGDALDDVVPPAVAEQVAPLVRHAMAGAETTDVEVALRSEARERVLRLTAFGLRDWRGEPYAVGLGVRDVTEQRHAEHRLRHLAEHDQLTGLVTRARFEEEVELELQRAARYGGTHGLLVLDLDNFKHVNDSWGHKAGDALLAGVAAALQERLRETDVVARLGGDEFAVLLREVDLTAATALAESLVSAVAAVRVPGARTGRASTSIGGCVFGEGWADAAAVVVAADSAMYDAKEAGRNRAVVREPLPADEARRRGGRTTWTERVRSALDTDGFALWAQPMRPLRHDGRDHYELLLRMVEDGGVVAPDAFLPSAERYDLIQAVDRWVVGSGIAVAAQHPDSSFHLNVSAKSLREPGLLRLVDRTIEEHGADPARIVFEVTETVAIANLEESQRFARDLRALGCRFALDDFGRGAASYYYLKHLPLDVVKIDGDFVRDLPSSRLDQLVVSSVVDVAAELGCETVAEFVEDEATLQLVQQLGVDLAQGYHVGMPAPSALLAG